VLDSPLSTDSEAHFAQYQAWRYGGQHSRDCHGVSGNSVSKSCPSRFLLLVCEICNAEEIKRKIPILQSVRESTKASTFLEVMSSC